MVLISRILLTACAAAGVALSGVAQAQSSFPVAKQILDQGGAGFPGSKVAVSGKWAVIGNGGSRCRADVYEFDYATSLWGDGAGNVGEVVQTLNDGGSCGAAPFGGFAESVAVAGDVIIIGAPRSKPQGTNLTNVGSFYIYTYTGGTWVEQLRVDNPVVDEGALFAWDVAVHISSSNPDNVLIAVGVPGYDNGPDDDVGSVYLYEYDLTAPATPPTVSNQYFGQNAGDDFGRSVDLNDDFVTAGAPLYDSASLTDDGAVYLFETGEPSSAFVQKITEADFTDTWTDSWRLGLHVAQKGDLLMIGAEQSYTLQRAGVDPSDPTFTLIHTFGIDGGASFSLFRDVALDNGLQAYGFSGLGPANNEVALWDRPASGDVPAIRVDEGETTYANSIDLDSSRLLVNGELSDVAYAYTFICGGAADTVRHMVWKTVSIPCAPPDGSIYTVAEVFGDLGVTVGDPGITLRSQADYLLWEQNGTDWDGLSYQNALLEAGDEVFQDRGYWLIWRDTNDPPDPTAEAKWSINSAEIPNPTRTPTSDSYAADPAYGGEPIVGHFILKEEAAGPPNNRLPIGAYRRSVLLGNPFDKPIDLSKALVEDTYAVTPPALMGSANGRIVVENATAWVYDIDNPDIPSGQNYRAVVASGTPGFGGTLQPYEGFWIKLLPEAIAPFVLLPLDF